MRARKPMEPRSPPVACGLAGLRVKMAAALRPDMTTETEVARIKHEDEADFSKLAVRPEKAK